MTAASQAELRKAAEKRVREPIWRPGALQAAGMLDVLDAATRLPSAPAGRPG